MTEEQALELIRSTFDDKLMHDEKRRVFRMLENKAKEMLRLLGVEKALEPHEERMKWFYDFVHIPGDSIFVSMQYVFFVARGDRLRDPDTIRFHLNRIYQALFTPAGLKNPVIPDMFWSSPLGIACKVCEEGYGAVLDILAEVEV
jgi:hypothetical protein